MGGQVENHMDDYRLNAFTPVPRPGGKSQASFRCINVIPAPEPESGGGWLGRKMPASYPTVIPSTAEESRVPAPLHSHRASTGLVLPTTARATGQLDGGGAQPTAPGRRQAGGGGTGGCPGSDKGCGKPWYAGSGRTPSCRPARRVPRGRSCTPGDTLPIPRP